MKARGGWKRAAGALALAALGVAPLAFAGITFNDLSDAVTVSQTSDCHGIPINVTEQAAYPITPGSDCIPPLFIGDEVFVLETSTPTNGRLIISDEIGVGQFGLVIEFSSDRDPDGGLGTIDSAQCLGPHIGCVVEDGTVQDVSRYFHALTAPNGAPLPSGSISFSSDVDPTVPEPASILLLGIGLAGIGFARRRKLH
jgi:hypothetical protein